MNDSSKSSEAASHQTSAHPWVITANSYATAPAGEEGDEPGDAGDGAPADAPQAGDAPRQARAWPLLTQRNTVTRRPPVQAETSRCVFGLDRIMRNSRTLEGAPKLPSRENVVSGRGGRCYEPPERARRASRAESRSGVKWLLLALVLGVLLAQPPCARAQGLAPERNARSADELTQLYALGLGYSGLGACFSHDLGARPASAGLTGLTLAAGTLSATALADHAELWRYGLPQAIVSDATLGFGIGAAWVWHEHERHDQAERSSPATQSGLLFAGATVGGALGAVRYALRPSPPAQAAFTSSLALWSGVTSALVTAALTDADQRAQSGSLALALGLELGVVSASLTRRVFRPASIGWVRWVDAGALLGAAVGAGTRSWVSETRLDERPALACASAGLVGGALAAVVTAPRSVTGNEGPSARMSIGFRARGPALLLSGVW